MKNNGLVILSGTGFNYAYQQQFQVAVNNFDALLREERLLKRTDKNKSKIKSTAGKSDLPS